MSLSLITMAQGGGPSLAELKRQLDSLAWDLFNIDLQIQQVKQGNPNPKQSSKIGTGQVTNQG